MGMRFEYVHTRSNFELTWYAEILNYILLMPFSKRNIFDMLFLSKYCKQTQNVPVLVFGCPLVNLPWFIWILITDILDKQVLFFTVFVTDV